jgi:hypothetical protein
MKNNTSKHPHPQPNPSYANINNGKKDEKEDAKRSFQR